MSETGGALTRAPPDCAARAVQPASHVHFTNIDGTAIVLDLRRDKYLALDAAHFASVLGGTGGDRVERTRSQLLADGVVVEPNDQEARLTGRYAPAHWPLFIAACLWAELQLRSRRLDLAVWSLRREQLRPRRATHALADALNGFRRCRPWYPRRNVCLFDSLALARFLIFAGHRVELVFGVRTNSFAAHCWVEVNGTIVNDEPQYCAAFQDIARIS